MLGQDRGHLTTGGQPGHEDAIAIDWVTFAHKLEAIQYLLRLAEPATLMLGQKPVPAALRVRVTRLLRVEHEHSPVTGHVVQARAGGKIGGALRAAVKRNEQRQPFVRRAGHEEPVTGHGASLLAI